jgi:hypothetical protein
MTALNETERVALAHATNDAWNEALRLGPSWVPGYGKIAEAVERILADRLAAHEAGVERLTADYEEQLDADRMHRENPGGCPVCTHLDTVETIALNETLLDENDALRAREARVRALADACSCAMMECYCEALYAALDGDA